VQSTDISLVLTRCEGARGQSLGIKIAEQIPRL